jgi:hypothetical protein
MFYPTGVSIDASKNGEDHGAVKIVMHALAAALLLRHNW